MKSHLRLVLLMLCVTAAAWIVVVRRGPAPPPLRLVATVEAAPRQTIRGWGIYPCTIQLNRKNANNFHLFNRPNAQRLLMKELGISYFRTELLPGSYDAKRDDGSLDVPYLDASLVRWLQVSRGFGHNKYILTVWSPPAPFKSPPHTLGKRKGVSSWLRTDRVDSYCRYVVKALDHITKRRGLAAPMAFSIQNEPGVVPDFYNGTAYSPGLWAEVFKKMRTALDAGGYRAVQMMGPECSDYALTVQWMGGPGASMLHNDPKLAAAMGGFAYHGYPRFNLPPTPEEMKSVCETARGLGKDIWQTEWCLTEELSPLDHTLDVAQHLGRETAYLPTNYWTWFQGWYFRHPKSEVLLTGLDDNNLHISKTYYFLKKLWHSAPAGSEVHRVQTTDSEIRGYDPQMVQTVAFQRDARLTVMVVNPGVYRRELTLGGLGKGRVECFRTDENHDMAVVNASGVTGGKMALSLPSRSVTLAVVTR